MVSETMDTLTRRLYHPNELCCQNATGVEDPGFFVYLGLDPVFVTEGSDPGLVLPKNSDPGQPD